MEIIKMQTYNYNSHCHRNIEKKLNKGLKGKDKIKLVSGAKKQIKFKPVPSWEVHTQPTVEFNYGNKSVAVEFFKDKTVVTSYEWITKKANGDISGIKNWKETEI